MSIYRQSLVLWALNQYYHKYNMKRVFSIISLLLITVPIWAQQDTTAVKQQYMSNSPSLQVGNDYILGHGDELEITIFWGNTGTAENYKIYNVEIQTCGEIFLPLIGKIKITNLTSDEVKRKLLLLSREYIRNPQVTVKVTNFVSRKVVVFGEAESGIYPIKTNTRIAELLSSIGGVRYIADLANIRVSRKNGEIIIVNFLKLLNENDKSQNILLQPDDLILIPANKESKIVVLGAVNSPRVIPISGKMSIIEALGMAQGGNRQAKLSEVKIIRFVKKKKSVYTVNLKELMEQSRASNVMLIPGDIVFVPSKKDIIGGFNNLLRTILPTLQTAIIIESLIK